MTAKVLVLALVSHDNRNIPILTATTHQYPCTSPLQLQQPLPLWLWHAHSYLLKALTAPPLHAVLTAHRLSLGGVNRHCRYGYGYGYGMLTANLSAKHAIHTTPPYHFVTLSHSITF